MFAQEPPAISTVLPLQLAKTSLFWNPLIFVFMNKAVRLLPSSLPCVVPGGFPRPHLRRAGGRAWPAGPCRALPLLPLQGDWQVTTLLPSLWPEGRSCRGRRRWPGAPTSRGRTSYSGPPPSPGAWGARQASPPPCQGHHGGHHHGGGVHHPDGGGHHPHGWGDQLLRRQDGASGSLHWHEGDCHINQPRHQRSCPNLTQQTECQYIFLNL